MHVIQILLTAIAKKKKLYNHWLPSTTAMFRQ